MEVELGSPASQTTRWRQKREPEALAEHAKKFRTPGAFFRKKVNKVCRETHNEIGGLNNGALQPEDVPPAVRVLVVPKVVN